MAFLGVVALLATLVVMPVAAAPVVVTEYSGLVEVVGSSDPYNTGERFDRYT